jgi:phosphoribosylamine--glycine ligase
MKVLIIGSGGREHALAYKISQSKLVDKIFCAPGNGGIKELCECVDIKADDINGLYKFASKEKIDLTVAGPEVPLSKGIVDLFCEHNLKIFGPCKDASQLESSKVFAKEILKKANVPTASFKVFEAGQINDALSFVEPKGKSSFKPVVIKADGLASGKGVIVAESCNKAYIARKGIW